MKIYAVTLLLCLTLAGGSLNAQQEPGTRQLSLKDALAFAKQNNATLRNAQLSELSAKKKVNEILGLGLPQVNGELSFNANVDIPTTILPDFLTPAVIGTNMQYFGISPTKQYVPGDGVPVQFGQKYSATGAISAGQLIFDGTFFLGVKASREFVLLSRMQTHRAEIDVETDVTKAYYFVLLNEARLVQVNKNIEALEKTLSDLKATFKAGFVEKIDVERLELTLSNAQIMRDQLKDGVAISYQVLKMHLGANVNDSLVLSDKLENLSELVGSNVESGAGDYNKRIEYQMAQQGLKLGQLDRKRYLTGYLPSITAFGTIQRNTFSSDFNNVGKTWFPATIIGAKLSLPIFDGFRKHAQTQQAQIAIEQTQNTIRSLENAIAIERYNARTTYSRNKEQLDIQKRNMELAGEIYKRAQLKLKEGVGSSTELLLAESDLKNAQTAYLSSMYDLMIAQLNLKKAQGY